LVRQRLYQKHVPWMTLTAKPVSKYGEKNVKLG